MPCKADTREKAFESIKMIFKSGDMETLARHLPIEIFCLLTCFLKAFPENRLDAIVVGKRKQEAVQAKCIALTKNKTLANILLKKLQEKKNLNFEFSIITTTITNNTTKCKIVDII